MKTLPPYARAAVSSLVRNAPLPSWRQKKLASQIHSAFPPTPQNALCKTRMKLGYRMILDLRSVHTEWETYYTGDFDTTTIRSIIKLVQPGWTVLDVGANIGFWTVPLAQAVDMSGIVHAFEPFPSNYDRLRRNIALNGLEALVKPHNLGLSDSEATLSLSLRDDFAQGSSTGNAAIVIDESDKVFNIVPIHVRPLDDLRAELRLDRIDFIKVDIEGHEDKFLSGAAESIAKFRPLVYLELNEPYYTRRGLDTTALFQAWLDCAKYRSIFERNGKWSPLPISERRQIMDNALFAPEEQVNAILAQLN